MSEFIVRYLAAQVGVAPILVAFTILAGLFNGAYFQVLLAIVLADSTVAAYLAG